MEDIKSGDLVYVDAYGPYTHKYSSGFGEMQRDKPFRPKVYNFNDNLQYEIIYMEGEVVTLFDNENSIIDLPVQKVGSKPFIND